MIEGIADRRRIEIPNADGSNVVKVILTSYKCHKDSDAANEILNKIWLSLYRSPNLYLMPEKTAFDSLNVKHNGEAWVFTFQVNIKP